ncbi:histidinol-phosphate transaminase [Ornithinimicrobium cryptoxanthini]|uniref:histidinol-phosphate transaminase n=1 Tax=Ornithinimicrobium cryptoxanthini TaxID=2934161 RepID=UPI00211732D2|nr:histidinol-phosphate transaminase [Ornithinimicrobium cryptoxanthini]
MTSSETPAKTRGRAAEPLQELFPAHLIRADLQDFTGYSSARTSDDGPPATIWLNANEASSASAVDPEGANRRYPDPQPVELVEALAQTYAVSPDRVVVGRGSDEAIDLLVRTLCRPGSADAVVQTSPTFGMYAVSARLQGVPVVDVPQRDLGDLWEVDVAAVTHAARGAGARLVFLASPGNPTGAVVPLDQVADLAHALADTAVVVIDEAYQEFAGPPSATTLLREHANLVVLRTLSKAHGLAGVRVGVALSHPDLATVLRRVQAPYPVPAPVAELAVSALSTSARRSVAARVAETRAGRERLVELLGADPRVRTVCGSEANFLLVRSPDVDALLTVLRGSGIVVRDMRHLLDDALRVTVGSPAEIDAVARALGRPAEGAPTASVQPPTDQLHDRPDLTRPTTTPARGQHP